MSANNAQIAPIKIEPENRVKILSKKELEKVHQATLTVLEETGVKFPSQKALEIFADGGADVDFDDQIVRIPSDLVMDALDQAPRTFTLGSRGSPELDLRLDGTKTYFCPDGTGTTTMDLETRKKRPSTIEDMEMAALICDYLPFVSLYWEMVSEQANPSFHEYEASIINTEKHIQTDAAGEEEARYLIKVIKLIAGDEKTLRNRPPISQITCTISPLEQDSKSIEAALAFAKAGIPVGFITLPTLGSTAPASPSGVLITGNAELLSIIALIQLRYPGTPTIYAFESAMMNPHTGGYTSYPHIADVDDAGVQLAHYYDLPAEGTSFGGTRADKPGTFLGRSEASGSSFLCGADISVGAGLLDYSMLLYPEKILYDYEVFKDIQAFSEGLDISSKSLRLARDEIMDVGPRGHFLTQKSTLENLDKLWDPGITRQWSSKKGDFKDPQEAAIEKVKWILENHKPKPLDEEVKKEMRKIFEEADQKLGKGR